MPLFINNEIIRGKFHTVQEFVTRYPHLKLSSEDFKSTAVQEIGGDKLLYVNQREFAVITPDDSSVSVIGSQDATTCHIVVLRDETSGVTALCHLDGSNTHQGLSDMLTKLETLSRARGVPTDPLRVDCHVVGGFLDDRGYSHHLTKEIIRIFSGHGTDIHLRTACFTDLNNRYSRGVHWPVVYGIAVNVATGEVFRAQFPDKGPDMDLRSARIYTGTDKTVFDIYDTENEQLCIGPFNYRPWPDARLWLMQPDEDILDNMSTSPKVEPPDFVAHVRSTLKQIVDHPYPLTTVFIDGTGHKFKKNSDTGAWVAIH